MKFWKKAGVLFAAAMLAFSLAVPALAANVSLAEDQAALMTDAQVQQLEQQMEEISDKWNCDVAFVTVDSLDGKTPQAYADDYFDENGLGRGTERSGIVFLLSMEDRDWQISTRGYGITAFTDYGINYIFEQMRQDLSDGNYASAFGTYAEECDRFLAEAAKGTPYDTNHSAAPKNYVVRILIGLGIGLGTAGIVCIIFAAQLKTRVPQREARAYTVPNTAHLTRQQDLYLYSHTERTRKPENQGGGSSTHISASGATYGGGGGKF